MRAISLAAAFTFAPRALLACTPYAAPPQGNGQWNPMGLKGGPADDVEKLIPVEQLPKAVYSALMGLGSGMKVQQVEMSLSKGRASYEI
ncbi:MAG: hypothetical protein ABI134_27965, partial [Byssovorax sp.]